MEIKVKVKVTIVEEHQPLVATYNERDTRVRLVSRGMQDEPLVATINRNFFSQGEAAVAVETGPTTKRRSSRRNSVN